MYLKHERAMLKHRGHHVTNHTPLALVLVVAATLFALRYQGEGGGYNRAAMEPTHQPTDDEIRRLVETRNASAFASLFCLIFFWIYVFG
jgi:cytochrome b